MSAPALAAASAVDFLHQKCNASEPQFPYLHNGDEGVCYFQALLRGSNTICISSKGLCKWRGIHKFKELMIKALEPVCWAGIFLHFAE